MSDGSGADAKPILRSTRISAWRIDAAFLVFVFALVAVTATIAFAWDATRGKGAGRGVPEASALAH